MLYLLIGLISGIISGLGFGGGTVLMPLMTIFAGMDQIGAQCTNLLSYIPSSGFALISHNRAGLVDKSVLRSFYLWGFPAMAGGIMLAFWLPMEWLRKGFAVFLIAIALWQWREGEKRNRNDALRKGMKMGD